MQIGYARVSTTDQDLDIQLEALTSAGCTKVFSEKLSGTSTNGRDQLRDAIDYCRNGDALVITRLDRLARSIHDLSNIAAQLKAKGVNLKATEQAFDTSTPEGRALFGMLGVFAEFETDIRKDRQAEGIARAKAAGVYRGNGRPEVLDDVMVAEISDQVSRGVSKARIARELGVSRSTLYRHLGK